ncbi:hypothetical protein L1987_34451 [Smallanthus sonchifolius]|uniref:Uncharacterized protein n=1 Tax=Smallanthus sonchifolius TaxID=185202 RepID=A0ACB9HUK8_9ASTR|nr:hypothetical protein L1987_34451 [Smallanthus sonchifolius]
MDNHYKPQIKTNTFRHWFSKTHNSKPPPSVFKHFSDESADEYEEDDSFMSSEMDPCILTDELRIFVATWNVAGRSPVGSLAVDLDEWLNVKESADIYVLGFQEIVPLKAKTVIGGEDMTEATNWNLLIGQILNNKCACRWMSPMLDPKKSEHYNYFNNALGEPSMTSVEDEEVNCCGRYTLMASKKMVGVFISVWINTSLFKKYSISSVKVSAVACGIMGYLGNKGSVSVSMSIEGTSFCFVVAHLASGEKKGDEGRRNHQVSEIFKRTTFTRQFRDECMPQPLTILGHDQIFWFGDLNYRCDRILWYGKGVKQHSYFRSESKFSDHRPVSALFSTHIELIKSDVASTVSCKQTEQESYKEEASSTMRSLISKSNKKGHRRNKRL